jgi:hypothetical protein
MLKEELLKITRNENLNEAIKKDDVYFLERWLIHFSKYDIDYSILLKNYVRIIKLRKIEETA